MKFSIKDFFNKHDTFTEEILNGVMHTWYNNGFTLKLKIVGMESYKLWHSVTVVQRCSVKRCSRNFTKLTGKHLCQSLFFIEFCEIYRNTFFHRASLVALLLNLIEFRIKARMIVRNTLLWSIRRCYATRFLCYSSSLF